MCSSCMATTPSPPKKSEWHTRVSDWEQRTKCRLCPLLTHPTSIGTPGERALEHQSQQLIIHTGIPLIHLVAGHKPNSTPGALPLPICRSTGCFKSVQCTCTALRACWLELGLGSQRQREYKSVHLQPLNASQKLVRNPEPGAGGSTFVFKWFLHPADWELRKHKQFHWNKTSQSTEGRNYSLNASAGAVSIMNSRGLPDTSLGLLFCGSHHLHQTFNKISVESFIQLSLGEKKNAPCLHSFLEFKRENTGCLVNEMHFWASEFYDKPLQSPALKTRFCA